MKPLVKARTEPVPTTTCILQIEFCAFRCSGVHISWNNCETQNWLFVKLTTFVTIPKFIASMADKINYLHNFLYEKAYMIGKH